jgi:ATP-dependent DNA ligase
MVAYKTGGSVRLISRQGKEFTQRFPEVTKAVAALGAESVILDTEVAVFDRQLVSRFEWLRAQPKGDVATPPHAHGLRPSGARRRGSAQATAARAQTGP